MASEDILVAAQTFVVGNRTIRKGETFRMGHPIVEGREQLFRPFEVDNEHETAVAQKRQAPKAEKPKAAAKVVTVGAADEREQAKGPASEA